MLARLARDLPTLSDGLLAELPNTPRGERTKMSAGSDTPVVVAANFVVEPLGPILNHWLTVFGLAPRLVYAPFDQIHQELANPRSLTRTNAGGFNLICLDPASWRLDRGDSGVLELTREAARLLPQLAGSSAMTIVCVFPALSHDVRSLADESCDILARAVSEVPETRFLRLDDVARLYNLSQVRDAFTEEIGHLPFSREFLAAAATRIARACLSVRKPRAKAIVLDCDGTLWEGVCAEDSPSALVISPDHAALHTFLVEKQREGILICLCSKNNDADVTAVFESGRTRPLTLENIAAARLDWVAKPDNLLSIADELGLDPAAIVFIDDNPIECREMEIRLPGVLTIEASAPAEVLASLRHLWTLDSSLVTEEDRVRTLLVKAETQRKAASARADDLEGFIENLRVVVDIRTLEAADIERVAQLSRRTTQFTSSGQAWTSASLIAHVEQAGNECVSVRVSDRFGNYGLVGAIMLSHQTEDSTLEGFFLSCRALGRRVEHTMFKYVMQLAATRGKDCVKVRLAKTNRNTPARLFFAGLIGSEDVEAGMITIPLAGLSAQLDGRITSRAEVNSDRDRMSVVSRFESSASEDRGNEKSPHQNTPLADTALYREIMVRFRTACDVIEAVRSQLRPRSDLTAFVLPNTGVERAMAEIWSKNLGVTPVGSTDNFFNLGGNSLQMIYILQDINDKFRLKLSLIDFIDRPTVSAAATLVQKLLTEGNENNPISDDIYDTVNFELFQRQI
jgi:FkbH-like protein